MTNDQKTISQLCADWRSGIIKLKELKSKIAALLLATPFEKHPVLFKKWVGQQERNKACNRYASQKDQYKIVDDELSNFFILPGVEKEDDNPNVDEDVLVLEFDD